MIVASVRPWNELSMVMILYFPGGRADARQLDGALVGLGPAVAEEALPAEAAFAQQLRQLALRLDVIVVRHVQQRPACLRMAFTTRGWQWPMPLTAQPGKKSRYFLPSASHTQRTLAPHDDHGLRV